ncbi:MAG: LysM domain-containing protein, partial [Arenimonas sp.]
MSNPPNKPDFSNVQGSVRTTEQLTRPDFSDVQSKVSSTEQILGGSGGGGSVGEQSYTVVKGDTLSHIAKHF